MYNIYYLLGNINDKCCTKIWLEKFGSLSNENEFFNSIQIWDLTQK